MKTAFRYPIIKMEAFRMLSLIKQNDEGFEVIQINPNEILLVRSELIKNKKGYVIAFDTESGTYYSPRNFEEATQVLMLENPSLVMADRGTLVNLSQVTDIKEETRTVTLNNKDVHVSNSRWDNFNK
jgi:DNA-binding LytR/AlgR family response regulator